MAIDHIPDSHALPVIDENTRKPEEIVEYLVRLVRVLQEDFLRVMISIINAQLNITNVGTWYSAMPGVDGTYPEGTYRLTADDDNTETDDTVELQRINSSDVWVKIARWMNA